MRKVTLDRIKVGSTLARAIYSAHGHSLLREGTVLTTKYLERLKKMGFSSAFIDDGLMDDIVPDESISEETRQQAILCIQEVSDDIKHSKPIKAALAKKVVLDIIDDIIGSRNLLLNLSDIRFHDNYTFYHSVNVTVISVMIGIILYYPYDRLCDLGLGVLLHDIGKTQIPIGILNKPGKLTKEEYQIVKQHTWYGFEALRATPEFKVTSAHVALQHHERYNGSGYPRELRGNDILEFARIAAVADVYDAMTNDRCYRKKIPVNKVRQHLIDNSGILFDPGVLDRFIEKIAFYPQGTKVVLKDDRSGVVIKQNTADPMRPIIRLFWDNNVHLKEPIEVNLLDCPDLKIVRVLDS
ncbi:MAG: HD-GYP domain-containing protein [Eubacteriales bacterium]